MFIEINIYIFFKINIYKLKHYCLYESLESTLFIIGIILISLCHCSVVRCKPLIVSFLLMKNLRSILKVSWYRQINIPRYRKRLYKVTKSIVCIHIHGGDIRFFLCLMRR